MVLSNLMIYIMISSITNIIITLINGASNYITCLDNNVSADQKITCCSLRALPGPVVSYNIISRTCLYSIVVNDNDDRSGDLRYPPQIIPPLDRIIVH